MNWSAHRPGSWCFIRVAVVVLVVGRSTPWVGPVTATAAFTVARFAPQRTRNSPLMSRTYTPNVPSYATASPTSVDPSHTVVTEAPPGWFPTQIQSTVDYDAIVSRLYLRHIVTETQSVANLAVQQYMQALRQEVPILSDEDQHQGKNHNDPFAQLATLMSACAVTRHEGGKIGWMANEAGDELEIFPRDVVQQLYDRQPKAGDIHVIQSSQTLQWHVVQVVELWMKFQADAMYDEGRVGSHKGKNAILQRGKLKGLGVTPSIPTSMQTYHIQTSGCQMNVADSERLAGVLRNELNMRVADQPQDADLVLFNTCSIRDHAEQKLYDALGPYAAQKRKGQKQMALIVTGCVAQQEGEALLRRVPEIDVVLGPQYVPFLKNVLESVSLGQQIVATAPMLLQEDVSGSSADWNHKPVRGHDIRAWVNIIHGCNEHCTYCVVPGTRGMEQSRTMEAILQEIIDLGRRGYKEVTLLGQNIDAYGRDMVPKRTFADLLTFLNFRIPQDDMRIRYVTSHPRYFSDRVIDAVANLDKVCECFHMPFQAGDDEVLRRMRRGYTYDSYMRIIRKIRDKAPDAAICGDVIVGFPGETDEGFEKTLQLMEEVHFDNLNTFAYSPRPNTEAATWDDQVPDSVKAERLQRVQTLAAEHGLERSMRYVGRVVPVLVEDGNPRNPAQVMGRTRQGRQVYFDGDLAALRGEIVDVHITEARTWSLMGEQDVSEPKL
jgi:tRNA-2-methylthio-N6-dimethylallyladenosine synthase